LLRNSKMRIQKTLNKHIKIASLRYAGLATAARLLCGRCASGLFLLAIGVIMFFIARLFFRKEIKKSNNQLVGKKELLIAFVITTGLLFLWWFKAGGHKWAAITYGVITLGFFLFGVFFIGKKKDD